jgi:uncharacterized membrane protein
MGRGSTLILVPAALLVIALMPMPYGYYTLLRIIVAFGAACIVWTEFSRANSPTSWAVLFALVAVVFNPFIPVHLSREVWAWLDVFAASMFAVYWWFERRRNTSA